MGGEGEICMMQVRNLILMGHVVGSKLLTQPASIRQGSTQTHHGSGTGPDPRPEGSGFGLGPATAFV